MRWPRRPVVLAASVGAAGLVVITMATRGGPTSAATTPAASPRTRAGAEPSAAAAVTGLKLELLDETRADLDEPERNPFRFRPRPAPAPAPAPRAAAPAPAAAAAPKPAAPAGPPPIQLRFIGLFEAPGPAGRVAIMSDGRGNVFQGKEGDIIEGRYRVGRVTADSLELSYVDGRGRQVIRLSGQ